MTGSFALVAGGAAGVTGISRELGADQQIVGVVQYLRVLVVVLTMPAVAALLAAGTPTAAEAARSASLTGENSARGLAFTAACVPLGLLAARVVRLPAASLLGPLLVATALTATGVSDGATVPAPVQLFAFAVIGLQVGLSFTRASVRAAGRVLPVALAPVVAMTAATAAVGIPLLQLTGSSVLDAYLATTPGGLYAVLATAADTGADTTLIATVQVLRLLVMLLVAPLLAAMLAKGSRSPEPPP